MKRVVALLGACHPGPAFAVTLLAGLLAGAVGLGPGRIALVIAAVLTGQLSIGWSNDLIDLSRDRAVGRTDKPLVEDRVSERVVRTACAVAVLATVPLSLACGWLAGTVHLVCVAAAWAYNLGVKSTPWSWLPYAVAFGGLPVFVSLTESPGEAPPLWLPVAGALLGVGAHFVNVLPDLEDDAATGVRGLPHRLGARVSGLVIAVSLAAASALLLVGVTDVLHWVGFGAGLAIAAACVVLVLRGQVSRLLFRLIIAAALLDVVLLALSGAALTA